MSIFIWLKINKGRKEGRVGREQGPVKLYFSLSECSISVTTISKSLLQFQMFCPSSLEIVTAKIDITFYKAFPYTFLHSIFEYSVK